ncbi:phosphodiesterase [Paenibacillus sp. J31TS4]|uniref:metallophosphoesterase family protein n=1 Tax=Paenibacillus sp. J31TS4 TaxID=2807195 RepID=UPI001B055FC4|nr:metallophosphoesterase family protein [Paenibacillus sp. J31TS4]GIP37762.1 phosphodiesterase [Paenibacillus sp. J31TS4]
MKLAILTDIHGNAPALKAVLRALDERGDVEEIYSLGDQIGIGPHTNEVLEELFARPRVKLLAGNHEEAVLHLLDGKGVLRGHEQALEHHTWVVERLDRRFADRLQDLPRSREAELGNSRMLLLHYHLTPEGLASIDPEPSGEKLDRRYAGTPYGLVAFGHHHPVHWFETAHRLYVNPGALGCHTRPTARYAIVEAGPDGRWRAELHEEPYDKSLLVKAYEEAGVPDRDFLLKAFHGVG